MTREEIIDGLEIYTVGRSNKSMVHITVEELQKFVDEIKTLEQEPCEDAISRQAVLELVADYDLSMGQFVKGIHALPPVTPRPKTGHWEYVQYDYNPKLGNWQCSECRCVVVECVNKEEEGGIPLYKYCPQCGAKMQEVEEE